MGMTIDLYKKHTTNLTELGFTIFEPIYSNEELEQLITLINQADQTNDTFRKSENLFAIRQFLKEIPETIPVIFNERLNAIISQLFGKDYFSVKSIYFDKPERSNWFVAYHQDLTISVNKKSHINGYTLWTVKQGRYAVQPPIDIIQNIFTVRIHLDDTDENNGALKVINGSHIKGIYRPETIDLEKEIETICKVPKGGIMIMKPLLMHSSSRTTSNSKRRVIHIEFSNNGLPEDLTWAEKINL